MEKRGGAEDKCMFKEYSNESEGVWQKWINEVEMGTVGSTTARLLSVETLCVHVPWHDKHNTEKMGGKKNKKVWVWVCWSTSLWWGSRDAEWTLQLGRLPRINSADIWLDGDGEWRACKWRQISSR